MVFKFPEDNWQVLLNPERESWQSVEDFFNVAKPSSGETWADIGCGPGYFALPLAKRVKKVYAVDSSEFMLSRCLERAREEGIGNIQTAKCNEEHIPLEDKSVEASLLANLFHELLKPEAFMEEVRRITKDRLIIIDWHPLPSPAGPPLEERIPKDRVLEFMESMGFELIEDSRVFPYHYFLIYKV